MNSVQDLCNLVRKVGEGTQSEMRDRLKGMERKRHLVVWGIIPLF